METKWRLPEKRACEEWRQNAVRGIHLTETRKFSNARSCRDYPILADQHISLFTDKDREELTYTAGSDEKAQRSPARIRTRVLPISTRTL